MIREGAWYVMFYIGFADEHTAQIGIARSRDGITGWERHPDNPILRARVNRDAWDYDACYKPYAIFHDGQWLLWYNGRKGSVEQIGLATHSGRELWPRPDSAAASTAARARRPIRSTITWMISTATTTNCTPSTSPTRLRGNFLRDNIPLFECPDKELEQTYYFRWWTYRKHIKQTPDGFVITEFLPPVNWAGKYNTISCPAAHHFYEGRWLHDGKYLDDYARFWFRHGGEPRRYSFWAADALWARHLVRPNRELLVDLLPDLIANYQAWEDSRRDPNGLFWQIDDRDGMEVSIGGSGYRATINSYMYGDALAIANIAELAGDPSLARRYRDKAKQIRQLVQEHLWDAEAQFFKVVPRTKDGSALPRADVRELHGYTPWYFDLPDPEQAVAWHQLMDPAGLLRPVRTDDGRATASQVRPLLRGPRVPVERTELAVRHVGDADGPGQSA